MQIEDVLKDNRKYFKAGVLKAIDSKGNVYFTLDRAIVEITETYFATEDSIIAKCRSKKAVNKFVQEFRLYQFNKS